MRYLVLLLALLWASPAFAASAVIASGQSLSGAVSIPMNSQPARIQIPAAWTTANLTFFVSNDSSATYQELYDGQGNEYTVVVTAANTTILLDPAVFAGIQNFKIQSGTTGTPVTQGGSRTLNIITR